MSTEHTHHPSHHRSFVPVAALGIATVAAALYAYSTTVSPMPGTFLVNGKSYGIRFDDGVLGDASTHIRRWWCTVPVHLRVDR